MAKEHGGLSRPSFPSAMWRSIHQVGTICRTIIILRCDGSGIVASVAQPRLTSTAGKTKQGKVEEEEEEEKSGDDGGKRNFGHNG